MSSSNNDPSTEDLLEVGRIGKAHGLRGEVLVAFVTNMVEARTTSGSRLCAEGHWLTVVSARPHKGKWLMTFEECSDRNAVEALRGRTLHAPPLDADSLAGGEAEGLATEVVAFVHDLIGKRLVDQHGNAHGSVVAVIDNPAADLLELEDGRLVPLTFYEHHDADDVVVDVPAGLLDGDAIDDGSQSDGDDGSQSDGDDGSQSDG